MPAREDVIRLIREHVHHPATVRELANHLQIPREDRVQFGRLVRRLVADGLLLKVAGNRVGLPDKMDLVVGRLQANPSGYGFVVPERAGAESSPDIFVPAAQLADAMHGDRVAVRVERMSERGREGHIVRVLVRGTEKVVGRFELDRAGMGFVTPFDRRLATDIQVPTGERSTAEPDDMVVARITRWPTPTRGPAGRIVEVLGRLDEPGVDTEIIIRKFQIPDSHSDAAREEAGQLGTIVREQDVAGRTDFRDVTTVTIDGEHARDFDDAITIERLPRGHYRLGVHIADVSHYVRDGSTLDQEAYDRGTSVYFPDRAGHMFPTELATGLCSLNPQVDRLVQSCLMEVDRSGHVIGHEMHDGVIRSDARMTYAAVNAILSDRDADTMTQYAPLVGQFELMHELFEVLRGRRRQRGSIDFDLPEAEVVLSEYGEIEDIVATERNVAHRIIEEFMLVANETVARRLVDVGAPALHRVHEAPDARKVEEFEVFLGAFGHSLGAAGAGLTPGHFQKLIERIHGRPEERSIATLMLRTMQKARYDVRSLGHFGLAVEEYTHFTSPIRRYPDLVVHRMLRESREGKIQPRRRRDLNEELPETARHTSEMERRADEAERELLQWKKVRFMADKIGNEYEGFVTGVTNFGLFVELTEHFVEGLVHISSMADDYYRFVPETHTLRGEETKKNFRLGDKIRVQVVRVDKERRQLDFGVVEILKAMRRPGRRHRRVQGATEAKGERRRAARPGRRERTASKSRQGRRRR